MAYRPRRSGSTRYRRAAPARSRTARSGRASARRASSGRSVQTVRIVLQTAPSATGDPFSTGAPRARKAVH